LHYNEGFAATVAPLPSNQLALAVVTKQSEARPNDDARPLGTRFFEALTLSTSTGVDFVAKDDKPETKSESKAPSTPPASAGAKGAAAGQQQQRVQVEIDDSKVMATYANFCRVTGTPEELIIDFGLNSQPYGVPTEPIPVTQRIITNFYTAKRMLHALQMTLQRHEATFGVLETDVQKRVRPGVTTQQQTSPNK
jgi:hypothetical protein